MRHLRGKDELKAENIVRFSPAGYTGLFSKVTGHPVLAFQIDGKSGESSVLGIEFESLDDLNEFLATMEKKAWEREHGEI